MNSPFMLERRFVDVAGRRVHFRRTGSGPPAVLLHGSPADSELLLPEIAAAAHSFSCYAFDAPGFGGSDPLPGETLEVADLALATAAAMEALGLPPCPVYGTHTGAAIALELGVHRPECVTGLVLEGVPIFSEAEMAALFGDYFASFDADPLGGHFNQIWMRFRDQFTWFPWTGRQPARLNPLDRPTPEDIHHWVMMYNRSRKTYVPAYRAACYYGDRGARAAAALTVPAVFMASEEDMLYGHLERLPPLRANQRIERLQHDTPAKLAAIVGFLRALPVSPVAVKSRQFVPAGVDPAVQFINTIDGQIFVRRYGDAARPAVMLLHDAPGTGLALQDLARRLAAEACVIVPDLPGCGESAAPVEQRSILDASADAVRAIADALGLESFTLVAIGCGCAVAATCAMRPDSRLRGVFLADPPVPDEATAQAIAPEIPLSPEGAHWMQAWLMIRDSQIYRPWFDGRVVSQRQTQGNFDADWLHDQTFALMKSRTTYFRLPRAAQRFDTAAALPLATVPVQSGAVEDIEAFIRRSGSPQ